MNPLLLVALYCTLVVFASLAGGWLPVLVHLSHSRMQLLVSLVAGLMLGVAMFHMLPHAVGSVGSVDIAMLGAMAGLLVMFFLLRAFHFHHHEPAGYELAAAHAHGQAGEHHHDHQAEHSHDHSHHGVQTAPLNWLGVYLGLSLHALIEGLALAAGVYADALHGDHLWLGVGTFLAILLHKPFDAVSITTVMTAGGWSAGWRNAVNLAFALTCPVGAALFLLGMNRLGQSQAMFVGCALAFTGGVFLCISLSDLLPEIEFHSHDRIKLSLALLAGVAAAYAIGFFEPDHLHGPGGSHEAAHAEHEHGHSHDHEHEH